MPDTSREFHFIIFGATGYTGRYVIEELANSTKNKNIKWAVAGRDVQKLQMSLELVQEYLPGKCIYCLRINYILQVNLSCYSDTI